MKNAQIAAHFEELGTLYELDGAVVYRVLAYRNAAKSIREAGVSVAEMSAQGRAEELEGIGKTIAEKITVLLETGSIPSADKLKAKIPVGLVQITNLPGLGPKRVRQLHDALGVESLDDLREAAEQGRIKDVPGFGAKAQEKVLAAIAAGADGSAKTRLVLSHALGLGEDLVAGLREHPAALRVELAGSARRWADSCKDLDIVAATSDPAALVEAFAALPGWTTCPAPAKRARAPSPTRGCRSTCGSCPRRALETCSSTSPALLATTRRCASRPSSGACT